MNVPNVPAPAPAPVQASSLAPYTAANGEKAAGLLRRQPRRRADRRLDQARDRIVGRARLRLHRQRADHRGGAAGR